jgi:hypothetical protein
MAEQPDFSQFTLMLKGHFFDDFKEGQVFEHLAPRGAHRRSATPANVE